MSRADQRAVEQGRTATGRCTRRGARSSSRRRTRATEHVDVEKQIAGGAMSGFAENYWSTRATAAVQGRHAGDGDGLPHGAQLPVYDYLAAQLLRLRPLVLLAAGRDDAEPLLRGGRHVRRTAGGAEAASAVQPEVVLPPPRRGEAEGVPWAGSPTTTCRCSGSSTRSTRSGRSIPALLRQERRVRPRELPRARREGAPPCRLVDRPELRRPHASGRRARTTTTRRPTCTRPEAGAGALRRGGAGAGLGEDDGDRSPTTSTAASTTTCRRRPARTTRRALRSARAARAGVRRLALGRARARSRRRSSTTRRSSRRSSPASAARPTAPCRTWAPACGRAPPRRRADRGEGPAGEPRADYQKLIDQTHGWGEKLATHPIMPTADGILSAPLHLTDFQEEFLEARQTLLAERAAIKRTKTA